jgi:6-phosphogluconolactonase
MSASDRPTDRGQPLALGFTRRQVLHLLGSTAAIAAVAPAGFAAAQSSSQHGQGNGRPSGAVARYVYVGTYTAPNVAPGATLKSDAVGIYVFRMDPTDGALTSVQVVPTDNPSFLAIDPTNKYLYSTNELGPGQVPTTPSGNGRFSAWAINQGNGNLSFINHVDSDGTFPAHLSVHPSGTYLLGSNYGTGNFPIYQINGDGSIGAMTDNFQDTGDGTGPNPARQEGPHAHQILTDPGVNHVFGVDLGADQVMAWNLALTGANAGKLIQNTVPHANVASGSGCRHMVFHPSLNFAYVIDELVSSITAFTYDPTRGAFIWIQTISTLPPKFTGTSTCAEIRVHPTGQFIYGTNRGHNSVAMFEIDQKAGTLDSIGWVSTQGEVPRGMNLDPSGTFLYVGNEVSNNIVVFRVNHANGKLQNGNVIDSPTPVDIEFGPPV